MAGALTLVDALMGGTAAMRDAGKRYLPQWPAEDDKSYEARLATATLFPAYQRTVSVLVGRPFSRPVTIGEDVPARIVEFTANVDLQRRDIGTFAADLTRDALACGFCGILVDCPPNPGLKSVAEEASRGIRPYLIHIRAGQVLGWRSAVVNGNRMLTQLRLLEVVEEDDGAFGVKSVEQVRVLEPGRWAIYRKVPLSDAWLLHEDGLTTLDVVPFVPVYGERVDFMIGTPPMIELGHANIEHWQSKSDQQTILHVARVPMLFAKQIGNAEIVIGAGAFIRADDPQADVKYVEHTGRAIEAGRMSLLDLEDRMRQTGAELLVIKPGNTTEVQTVSDDERGVCDLQRIMQGIENSLDNALDLMARWIGEPKGGHVSIYRDFGAATLAEASSQLLFDMWSGGGISHPTLLEELKRRGILGPDVDVVKEIETAGAEGKEDDAEDEADQADAGGETGRTP